MGKMFGNEDPKVEAYVASTYQPEDDVLRDIRQRALRGGLPDIHVAALDARHLEVLTRMTGARRAIEVGTLAGYSGVAILRGMPPDGVLDTFEIDPAHAAVAAESFRRAGFADRARIHLGPALQQLERIGPEGPFDLCFIDADKVNYAAYLDWAARHLRQGGVVIADNAFLFGRLGDTTPSDKLANDSSGDGLRAMRALHERLARGGDFRATVLPTGEGLAVGVRV